MRGWLSTFLSTFALAAKRLWNHRLLTLCLLVGFVAAVGLLSSIPLYSDAVHHRLLQGELTEEGTYRPAFAFLWRYVGAWHGEIGWAAYTQADEYLSKEAVNLVDLPVELQVRHVRTGNLRLVAVDSQQFPEGEPLLWTNVGFITGLESQTELVQGAFPGAGQVVDDVPVMVSLALAERMGLQVGERYLVFGEPGVGQTTPPKICVRIAGIWRPIKPQDAFWFYPPRSFDEVLLTSEKAFVERIVPSLDAAVSLAVWYQVFDGNGVRSADVAALLGRVATAESRAEAELPNATLDVSPVDALKDYRRASRSLTAALSTFSIPVLGLVLYFTAQIASMIVRRNVGEIAILRSRGTTRAQVLFAYVLEELLLGGMGLAGGLALAPLLAQAMGRTRSFLELAFLEDWPAGAAPLWGEPLNVFLSPAAFAFGLVGVGMAVLALMAPALAASRHTIVTFKWEQARVLVPPLWQRYFLDLLLAAPVGYAWYLLRRQGSIVLTGGAEDPFSNPLLLLAPGLFCFVLALLFVRVFPWAAGLLAHLAEWLPGTTPVLTTRQFARSAGRYTGPLLLLGLTLCLAIFSASVALTLDSHLEDQVYYDVGADLRLAEMGESTEMPGLPGQGTVPRSEDAPRWLFLPVSEHLKVAGVGAAARVGDFSVTAHIGRRPQMGRMLGVDRLDFPGVAFFRPGFAEGESLGGLMNRLAMNRASILANRGFLARNGLAVGDLLRLTVSAVGESSEVEFIVAGALDLFPTLYPQDGPFFVANLEYIHEGMGGILPYDVWLATERGAATEAIIAGVRGMGVAVVNVADARAVIAEEQSRPQRQGLFGLLSVGFLAAAGLTVMGFLLYAVASFRRRFIELGMLRALGLSGGQMAGHLIGEQALLVLAGTGLGTALGVWMSRLFIPHLWVGADETAQLLPLEVLIAWDKLWTICAVFAAMFALVVILLMGLLLRMRVFEAVKLGEAE